MFLGSRPFSKNTAERNPSWHRTSLSRWAEISRKVAEQEARPSHESAPQGEAGPRCYTVYGLGSTGAGGCGADRPGRFRSAAPQPSTLPTPASRGPSYRPSTCIRRPGPRAGASPPPSHSPPHPPPHTLETGWRGQSTPRAPHNPAREATLREEGRRSLQPAHTQQHRNAHPGASQPSLHNSWEKRPSHPLPPRPSHPGRFPKTDSHSLTQTPASTPSNNNSDSSGLADSDRRQHVYDTFAIAVKRGQKERRRASSWPGCSGARSRVPPCLLLPRGSRASGWRWRGQPGKVGREER